jgi:hypothetical protein
MSRAEIVERKGVAFVSGPENVEMFCELARPLRDQFQSRFLAATARCETVPLPQHRELRKSSSSLGFEMPAMKLCYSRLILPTVLVSNGKHYSPETIFKRWQRCFQKQRCLEEWTGLNTTRARSWDRYVKPGKILRLYAF